MLFNGKPLDSITEDDLQGLIEQKVSEKKIIEYKLELSKGNDSDTKEFLYDVSSFANASGGHLIYGVRAGTEEDKSLPVELCGLDGISDIDQVVLGLNQKILAGIRPRIPGLNIQAVSLQNSKYAIVIEMPKSFSSPHMVIFKNDSKFYSRNSKGKYQLDVDELRLAFTLSQNIKERIIDFRRERLGRVVSGETPVPLESGAKLVLHIIPISAFDSVFSIDVKDIVSLYNREINGFITLEGSNKQPNFDGFLIYSSDVPSSTYLQIFRNGIVEALNTRVFRLGEGVNKNISYLYRNFEETVIRKLGHIVKIQHNLGLEPPILIMLSMLGVKNYSIGHPDQTPHDYLLDAHPITEDSLILPEVMIEDYNIDLYKIMKPTFDIVWNAAGYPGSLNYT